MTGGGDKVKEGVDSVIPEAGVSFNPGLFGEDIVVLSFQVASHLGKTSFVINLVTKSRCINHRQRNTCSLLLEI
jgi:hypothetical protein